MQAILSCTSRRLLSAPPYTAFQSEPVSPGCCRTGQDALAPVDTGDAIAARRYFMRPLFQGELHGRVNHFHDHPPVGGGTYIVLRFQVRCHLFLSPGAGSRLKRGATCLKTRNLRANFSRCFISIGLNDAPSKPAADAHRGAGFELTVKPFDFYCISCM